MPVISIIQKSQLEGAKRLDAEYYQPEYFIDFSKGEWISIGECLKTCQYGLSQAMNDKHLGYPMFKMDNIVDGFLFDDDVRYAEVSKKDFEHCQLVNNDVLFNRVNSEEFVGRTGIYKVSNLDSVFASYLIRLQVKTDNRVLPDYLNIFLNCDFGTRQIRKFARRAVNQANVNAEELKQMKIALLPLAEQEKITNLSDGAWHEFETATSLYSQAEQFLLEEIGLADFEEEAGLWSVVRLSEARAAERIDAEYFQPKYERLESRIKSYGVQLLAEVIETVPAKFDPAHELQKMFKYVELSNINASIGVVDGYSEISGKEAPSRAKRVLKENDVIVSSVEGSLGKVALIGKEQAGYLASTGFFQFRSKHICPEVLLVMAKSPVLQLQLEKRCAGTILTAVPKESIKDVIVPILPEKTQQKIAELVRQSHESRAKAKRLLEDAKRKVEELIEAKQK